MRLELTYTEVPACLPLGVAEARAVEHVFTELSSSIAAFWIEIATARACAVGARYGVHVSKDVPWVLAHDLRLSLLTL